MQRGLEHLEVDARGHQARVAGLVDERAREAGVGREHGVEITATQIGDLVTPDGRRSRASHHAPETLPPAARVRSAHMPHPVDATAVTRALGPAWRRWMPLRRLAARRATSCCGRSRTRWRAAGSPRGSADPVQRLRRVVRRLGARRLRGCRTRVGGRDGRDPPRRLGLDDRASQHPPARLLVLPRGRRRAGRPAAAGGRRRRVRRLGDPAHRAHLPPPPPPRARAARPLRGDVLVPRNGLHEFEGGPLEVEPYDPGDEARAGRARPAAGGDQPRRRGPARPRRPGRPGLRRRPAERGRDRLLRPMG